MKKSLFKIFLSMILTGIITGIVIYKVPDTVHYMEEKTFDYEDKDMSEIFFKKHEQDMSLLGVNYIKNDYMLGRLTPKLNIDYSKLNLKHISDIKVDHFVSCSQRNPFLLNYEEKTLKFNFKDIGSFGKESLFQSVEDCLQNVESELKKLQMTDNRYEEKFPNFYQLKNSELQKLQIINR